ncbi:MAG: serine protease [Bdellovibrionales bacterium]
MTFTKITQILAISTLLFGVSLQADPGFSNGSNGLPSVLQQAWMATVRVESNGFLRNNSKGVGTGVIVGFNSTRNLALIATANHAVDARMIIFFETQNEKTASATSVKVLAKNAALDLALLSVEVPGEMAVTPVPLADLTKFGNGHVVYTIGHPNLSERRKWVGPKSDGEDFTKRVSSGKRFTGVPVAGGIHHYHDADLLPGNSGGPLLDEAGALVGINIMIGYIKKTDGFPYCQLGANICLYIATSAADLKKMIDSVAF